MKRLEDLTRVFFIATLNPDVCAELVHRVFPEFIGDPCETWIPDTAVRRIRQNCSQWKSRSLKNMTVSDSTFAAMDLG